MKKNEFFADTANTSKEGVEQHRKQESSKGAITEGKVLVGHGKVGHNGHRKGSIRPATRLLVTVRTK